jgi:hypothetical protein
MIERMLQELTKTEEEVEIDTLFFSTLNEKHKRLYAGREAIRLGYYGVEAVSKKYDIHPHTVRRGKKELLSGSPSVSDTSIRKVGGGRKKKF